MAPMSQEDLEWLKSTFHSVPRLQLPDDCIEYSLYLLPSSTARPGADDVAETQALLLGLQRSASELTGSLLKHYIWQRDGFNLEVLKENGITFLRGRTNYGDSIEDEWVIVYILRELTKKHSDLWVKVIDNDGEFLLVEAAGMLPRWIEPEIAENRVWIHGGQLVIIKPKYDQKKVTEKLPLQDAWRIIKEDPSRLLHSSMIEAEAFYRLRNYPKQISENMHSALVTIPRSIAHLLHQKPAYISPAVETFYTRDPIALRPLKSKDGGNLMFPPRDFVTISVRFTKVGYAHLKSQDFPVPSSWSGRLPNKMDFLAYSRAETGMKVTCGFEMLLSDPQNQNKTFVREIRLLLEDIDTGDGRLPTDEEIENSWPKNEDDEKWMDISFDDLEGELRGQGRGASDKATRPGAFGDSSAQENLQRIVARFEEFLNNDCAGLDGADFMDESDDGYDDDDELSSDEDKDIAFDEEEFSEMMKEMMSMPSGSVPPNLSFKTRPRGRMIELDSESGQDDREKIEELSRQIEAELRPTGVLDLNCPPSMTNTDQSSKEKASARTTNPEGGQGAPGEDDNINLAENLLESIQSQAGLPGPVGNLLGMMGMRMPPDDRES